ncbi:spore coat protein U domain-containing protein [Persephonella sp.]
MKRIKILSLIMGIGLLGNAFADTAGSPGDFNIEVNVIKNCKFTQVTDISGTYDPLDGDSYDSQAITVQNQFKFKCNKGTTFTLTAISGNNPSGTVGKLVNTTDPNEILYYRLGAEVDYGTLQDDDSNLFNPNVDGVLSLTAPNYNEPTVTVSTVFLNNHQDVMVGTYEDNVTLQLSF